jgi:hypothetical protein
MKLVLIFALFAVCFANTMTVEQSGGCSICQLVVSYVENFIASNASEAEVIQQLDQVCALLGPLQSTCVSFVQQYVPQLVLWIQNNEDPQQFCAQAGLCSSVSKSGKIHHSHKREAQQAGCSVCELVVQYVETYLASNQTETQIIQQLDQVAPFLVHSAQLAKLLFNNTFHN